MWWHLGAGRAYCRLSVRREASFSIILALKSTLSGHYKTWNPKNDPVMTHAVITWRTPKQVFPCLTRSLSCGALECYGATLCCTGVLAPSISVPHCGRPSNVQQSSAVMDLLLKPICVFFFHKGMPNYAGHDAFRRIAHLPKGELWCLHQSWADLWERI